MEIAGGGQPKAGVIKEAGVLWDKNVYVPRACKNHVAAVKGVQAVVDEKRAVTLHVEVDLIIIVNVRAVQLGIVKGDKAAIVLGVKCDGGEADALLQNDALVDYWGDILAHIGSVD